MQGTDKTSLQYTPSSESPWFQCVTVCCVHLSYWTSSESWQLHNTPHCVYVSMCVHVEKHGADCVAAFRHLWIDLCFFRSLCLPNKCGNSNDNRSIKMHKKTEWMLLCISWFHVNFRNSRHLSQTWTSLQASTDPWEQGWCWPCVL